MAKLSVEQAYQLEHVQGAELDLLRQQACEVRDQHWGKIMTYSRKVFVPLTNMCRDECKYCTFVQHPDSGHGQIMTPQQVLAVVKQGQKMGCKEVLFSLGEKPELRYRQARQALAKLGFTNMVDYLADVCALVLKETTLLPHVNVGTMNRSEFIKLKPVSASMGMMLETVSERLLQKDQAHFACPDKVPAVRIATIADAGEQQIPYTTGILIGIGETWQERIDSLLAINQLHRQYGHIQEVIVQNFCAKSDTAMASHSEPDLNDMLRTLAVARLLLDPSISLQAPPNLQQRYKDYIGSGINDWGGISPLTKDFINPERAWPQIAQLATATEECGYQLQERLAVYPQFLPRDQYFDQEIKRRLDLMSRSDGLAKDQFLDQVTVPSLNIVGRIDSKPFNRSVAFQPQPSDKLQQLLSVIQPEISMILERVLANQEVSEFQGLLLFGTSGRELEALIATADLLRIRAVGNNGSFVITRNINFTNVCNMGCKFCGFAKRKNAIGAELLSFEEVAQRAQEAWDRGATEVCIQGGLHPDIKGDHYRNILIAIKKQVPDIHIHAFSPFEIWYGARKSRMSTKDFISDLMAHGLGSMPGTAAEILDVDIRKRLTKDKLSTKQWIDIITTAHQLGLPTTATIMYGHIDNPSHWVAHIGKIRSIQKQTGGFTEFVPLGFVHYESPLFLNENDVRPGPTSDENIKMHAISRLMLNGWIDNIQASWVKLGPEYATQMLRAGVNDLGGTLMNESITRSSGGKHGQEIVPAQMIKMITEAGLQPVRRNTLYQILESFDPSENAQQIPVVTIPVVTILELENVAGGSL